MFFTSCADQVSARVNGDLPEKKDAISRNYFINNSGGVDIVKWREGDNRKANQSEKLNIQAGLERSDYIAKRNPGLWITQDVEEVVIISDKRAILMTVDRILKNSGNYFYFYNDIGSDWVCVAEASWTE